MDAKEKAAQLHKSGFNCAQSVLAALGDYTGLEESAALAISGGFGGVRCGEICGALSGAVMAIGLAFPYSVGTDAKARNRIARLTVRCTSDFKEKFGCLRCQDLKRNGQPCPLLIQGAAELAEEIIQENL